MNARITRLLAGGLTLAVATTSVAWTPASAGHPNRGESYPVYEKVDKKKHKRWRKAKRHKGWKHARHPRYGPIRYEVVHHRRYVVVRPIHSDYFIIRRPRYVVVRPVPYWSYPANGLRARIGARIGNVDLDLDFRDREAIYGCNFCPGHFSSYGSYASHVTGCDYRPRGVRVIVEAWDDDDLDYFSYRAHDAWDDWDDDDYDYDD